jgi:hypothetical protein
VTVNHFDSCSRGTIFRPKLLQDLEPGTRVFSKTFDMGDWKPGKKQTLEDADEEEFSSAAGFFSGSFRNAAKTNGQP